MARRRKRQRERFLLALFLCATLASILWYFFIYARTPEYGLKSAIEAVRERDVGKFCRYVDLPFLASKAYDDLTVDLFAYDSTLTPQTKILFEKFYVYIKPEMTAGMEETVKGRIESGEWHLPEGTDILKGRQLGIDYERFLERSQMRNTMYNDIVEIKRHGTTATATIKVTEEYTSVPFDLEVALQEGEDGHWQVTHIKNYKEYLDRISPLQNQDIADYIDATKSVVDRYNKELAALRQRFVRLGRGRTGNLNSDQRAGIRSLLQEEVIPTLRRRQQELDDISVPAGAAYLARLRQQSTEISIKVWQHYVRAITGNRHVEFETAQTLHKEQMELDLRIEDIIKHTAVSKNIPNIP